MPVHYSMPKTNKEKAKEKAKKQVKEIKAIKL